jgi:glycosyltransferase involved in cell wall biosynthesis
MAAFADSRLSLVIPVYNGSNYLAQALESVFVQTRKPDEIILVDDGSTDDSVGIARQFGPLIRTVRQTQSGIPAARNRGISESSGGMIAFLDHDDLLTADSLERRAGVLIENPEIDFVFGRVEQFVSPELAMAVRNRLPKKLPELAARTAGATIFRRRAFTTAGCFAEALRVGYMIEWIGRAETNGLSHRAIDTLVLRRRIHADNNVHDSKALERHFLDALRSVVRYKKAAGGTR